MRKYIIAALALSFFASCNHLDVAGLFKGQSPTVEVRFRKSMEYNGNNPIPAIRSSRNGYKIFVCTDLHAETCRKWVAPFVAQVLDDTVTEPFGLCLGDMVYTKDTHHVVWDALSPLRDAGYELFVAIGNHDLYYNDWSDYESFWHTTAYTFEVITPSAGTDLFITFDSADGTIGASQREWLLGKLDEARDKAYRHIILFTHTHFFKRDSSQSGTSNYNSEETIDLLAMFAQHGVDCVLTGHDHYYEYTRFRGVDYYTLNSMAEYDDHASYYLMSLADNIELSEIKLSE